jgi:hypothetical protein
MPARSSGHLNTTCCLITSRSLPEQGENSSESIFEVQATATEEGARAEAQYAQVQGVRGTPNLGWGFNRPSRDLDAAYEPGDLRHQATILFPWEALPDGSGPYRHRKPHDGR